MAPARLNLVEPRPSAPPLRRAKPKRLTLVVPCFNEEAVLPETIARLIALLDELTARRLVSADSGVTFVDDGSRDATWDIIETAQADEPRIGGIRLSGNRGHQHALLAGLLNAPGEVLISLDADLQDDLGAIPRMLEAHARGAAIVYGVRSRRRHDTVFKRQTARAYYWLLRRLGVDVVADHADFRLMSRQAVDALSGFTEVNLFLRGIVPLLGFPSEIVTYERNARFAGETKYPLSKMIALAANGVFSFSTVPLQWITIFGFVVALGSVGAGFWALGVRLFTARALPGWASTVIPMYFLGSVQLLAIGIIGGYVSRIYAETKRRPRFIIEKSI
ncbi:glycosyltransferase family 2 protein [Phenylobacterium sp.]|uniref:glycosyltransferase family 2 protein n=1 Tax=Phenylobacterium sp. TaxID=1871053 RepID=UPI0026027BC2|nr:glycosyltransferase family 2 protein [Phenylobacterium sp.]